MKTLIPLLALLSLSSAVLAAPVTYPGPITADDTGAVVYPTSITVASVTDLDGNAISTPGAVGHVAGPNTSVVYDAAAKGEAWITLTPVLSGHTFVNSPPRIFASADPQTLAAVNATTGTINTTTTSTNTLATGINTQTTKIATNAADSPNAVTAQGQAGTTSTAVAALPGLDAAAVWGATVKTITGGTVTTVTNPVALPTTVPAGYGGTTGDTPGTTTLLAKIGTPAGVSLSADVAAVKSDTGSLVTSVAGLPAAVWTYTASDGLTHQQSDALRTAILTRGFSVAYNAATRTQVTSYFKADNTTTLATTTVVYDVTGRAVTRTTAFANLP